MGKIFNKQSCIIIMPVRRMWILLYNLRPYDTTINHKQQIRVGSIVETIHRSIRIAGLVSIYIFTVKLSSFI